MRVLGINGTIIVLRGGLYDTNIEVPPRGANKETTTDKKREYSDLIEESKTAAEFLSGYELIDPKSAITNSMNVSHFAKKRYEDQYVRYQSPYDPNSWEYPMDVRLWYDLLPDLNGERVNILLIYGASRLGKTKMARSLGPHSYHKNLFSLEQYQVDYKNGAKYVIFDDFMETAKVDWSLFSFHPNLKPFTDSEPVTMTDKYMKKSVVQTIPLIILTNNLPMDLMDSYWDLNITLVTVTEPTFTRNPSIGTSVVMASPETEEFEWEPLDFQE